jgi:hypothetical protein
LSIQLSIRKAFSGSSYPKSFEYEQWNLQVELIDETNTVSSIRTKQVNFLAISFVLIASSIVEIEESQK